MSIKYFLVRKKFKSFKELCKTIHNHYELMEWYKFNNIKWPNDKGKDPNDKPFEWPDYIIKSKVGLCWDHAIFSYYWCKNHNIKPYMVITDSIIIKEDKIKRDILIGNKTVQKAATIIEALATHNGFFNQYTSISRKIYYILTYFYKIVNEYLRLL